MRRASSTCIVTGSIRSSLVGLCQKLLRPPWRFPRSRHSIAIPPLKEPCGSARRGRPRAPQARKEGCLLCIRATLLPLPDHIPKNVSVYSITRHGQPFPRNDRIWGMPRFRKEAVRDPPAPAWAGRHRTYLARTDLAMCAPLGGDSIDVCNRALLPVLPFPALASHRCPFDPRTPLPTPRQARKGPLSSSSTPIPASAPNFRLPPSGRHRAYRLPGAEECHMYALTLAGDSPRSLSPSHSEWAIPLSRAPPRNVLANPRDIPSHRRCMRNLGRGGPWEVRAAAPAGSAALHASGPKPPGGPHHPT
jgi:hypothetical protein